MRLKKPVDEVLNDIYCQAMNASDASIRRLQHEGAGPSTVYTIQCAIADAIRAGFKSLLDNQYTDDDFERDLNLK